MIRKLHLVAWQIVDVPPRKVFVLQDCLELMATGTTYNTIRNLSFYRRPLSVAQSSEINLADPGSIEQPTQRNPIEDKP